MTDYVVPPGWPAEVRPPGSPDWERTVVGWLLDLCPGDYRAYDVLRRHPVVLARFAARQVAAQVEATREGLGALRTDLRDVVAPDVVEAAGLVLEREGARLLALSRSVDLVEQALRGGRFRAKL